MKFYKAPLACIVTLALSGAAFAEIYESKDAQGNPVFSDTPTAVSNAVDLPATNTADAPPDIPEAAHEEAPKAAPASTSQTQGEGDTVIIGRSRNERLEEEIADHRGPEVHDAPKPLEEGGAGAIGKRVPPDPKARPPQVHPQSGVQ